MVGGDTGGLDGGALVGELADPVNGEEFSSGAAGDSALGTLKVGLGEARGSVAMRG
jgi:hypothetical protein